VEFRANFRSRRIKAAKIFLIRLNVSVWFAFANIFEPFYETNANSYFQFMYKYFERMQITPKKRIYDFLFK